MYTLELGIITAGFLFMLALVIGTGAAGAWLARREGLKSCLAVQAELATGNVPGRELVHGVLILLAGIVLITPGVITDAIGLALLLRPVRLGLIARFQDRFQQQITAQTTGFVGGPGMGFFWSGSQTGPGTGMGVDMDMGVDPEPRTRPAAFPEGREILVDSSGPDASDDPPG
jgi:UPF0716 protein FxsA